MERKAAQPLAYRAGRGGGADGMEDCCEPKGDPACRRAKPVETQSASGVERIQRLDSPGVFGTAQDPSRGHRGELLRTQERNHQPDERIWTLAFVMRRLLVLLIVIYQRVVSPWLAPQCRFYPSCSEWTREAIESYGVLRGLALALARLLSCLPFHPGGFHPLRRGDV